MPFTQTRGMNAFKTEVSYIQGREPQRGASNNKPKQVAGCRRHPHALAFTCGQAHAYDIICMQTHACAFNMLTDACI